MNSVSSEEMAFVCEYYKKFGTSLAKHINDEWGLDINTVKKYVCEKLVNQAKAIGLKGIYYGDYLKIKDIDELEKWIDDASAKIRAAMAKATETYTVKAGENAPLTEGQKKVQKETAKQIVKELMKATGGWNDHDAMKVALDKIGEGDTEVLKEVNRLLVAEGYVGDNLYTPIEKFMKEEFQRIATDYSCDELESYIQ